MIPTPKLDDLRSDVARHVHAGRRDDLTAMRAFVIWSVAVGLSYGGILFWQTMGGVLGIWAWPWLLFAGLPVAVAYALTRPA